MNNNLTEMIFILDMSGSMSMLAADTIGGYNTMIEEQKKQNGDAVVTTVLFDDRYKLLHDRVPIQNIKPLTEDDYVPCGMTALYDAIGKTFVDIGVKLNNISEDERPGKVVVTIITDGYENASREYDVAAIKSMITEQQEKYSWIITFIGANIDSLKAGTSIGIDTKLSKSFTSDADSLRSVYAGMSASISGLRSMDFVSVDSMTDYVDTTLNSMIINNE